MNTITNPITIIETKTFSKYRITNISIILNIKAVISVCLYNDDETKSDSIQIELTGSDYQNWGSDDTYVHNFIKNKISEMYPN